MARVRGRGQKLDKYYRTLNNIYLVSTNEKDLAVLQKCINEVLDYNPLSDYESKDKDNLLYYLRKAEEELLELYLDNNRDNLTADEKCLVRMIYNFTNYDDYVNVCDFEETEPLTMTEAKQWQEKFIHNLY